MYIYGEGVYIWKIGGEARGGHGSIYSYFNLSMVLKCFLIERKPIHDTVWSAKTLKLEVPET